MSATTPHRIVVTRQLPPQGQQLLDEAAASGRIELVQWGESENAASKEWVLQKLGEGATSGVLCMLGDKVRAKMRLLQNGASWDRQRLL